MVPIDYLLQRREAVTCRVTCRLNTRGFLQPSELLIGPLKAPPVAEARHGIGMRSLKLWGAASAAGMLSVIICFRFNGVSAALIVSKGPCLFAMVCKTYFWIIKLGEAEIFSCPSATKVFPAPRLVASTNHCEESSALKSHCMLL